MIIILFLYVISDSWGLRRDEIQEKSKEGKIDERKGKEVQAIASRHGRPSHSYPSCAHPMWAIMVPNLKEIFEFHILGLIMESCKEDGLSRIP